jgi:SAM-dependent methyltransferase
MADDNGQRVFTNGRPTGFTKRACCRLPPSATFAACDAWPPSAIVAKLGTLQGMDLPSLDEDYFAHVYAATSDPWDFATSPYENAKYRATIEALAGRQFTSGLEIGCSVGVLTTMLANSCDALLAIDINARALEAARTRCASLDNVRFERMMFPREAPAGPFDLIVVSEVAYYWSDADLRAAIDSIARAARGGTVELVHFLPKVDDYLRDGDAVHAAFLADPRFARVRHVRADRYRIDVVSVS